VDVGGALLDRVHEHHVDELDDRRLVGRLLQLEDVDLWRLLTVLSHDLDVARSVCMFERTLVMASVFDS